MTALAWSTVGSVTRLEWERARERDSAHDARQANPACSATTRRLAKPKPPSPRFVKEHGLRCSKCGIEKAEWAKTGISQRGAWAICVACASEHVPRCRSRLTPVFDWRGPCGSHQHGRPLQQAATNREARR